MLVSFMLIFHALLVIAFSVRILLRDDLTPPARLAWFVVLNVLPYLGSVVYFLFGEVDIGNKARHRQEQIFAEISESAGQLKGQKEDLAAIDRVYRPAFAYAASINQFQPVLGNRAELIDNDAVIARMIADMDAAKDSIHVLYYIWLKDKTGQAVAEALMRAAQRGVKCRVIADGLGSRAFTWSKYWRRMRKAGVELAIALPISRPITTILTSRLDLRNHRKITVIDEQISYCGSRNCADAEFLVKKKYGPWIDVTLRFEGPVVAQNQLLFASDWMQATKQSFDVFMPVRQPKVHENGFPALVMGVGPTERRRAAAHLFVSLFASAEHSLVLSTPYFVPDQTTLEALCAAAYRGVEVSLIFPAKNDSWIVAAASHSYYRQLLEAGCKIYEHSPGLLHAKTLTIDGLVSFTGSSNLDLRSFDLNYENNILLQDAKVTTAIEQQQQQYIQQSQRIRWPDVLTWSLPRRIWNNIIATIGPIL